MLRKFSAPVLFIFIISIFISIPFSLYECTDGSLNIAYQFSLPRQRSDLACRASEEYFYDDLSSETGLSLKKNISVANGQAQLEDNVMEPGEHSSGLWHFDNGTWNTADDSSGHGNDGTIYGGTIANGLMGGSLELDGVNDYVGIPYNNKFNFGTASFAITGWFRSPGPFPGGSISVRVVERNDDAEEYAMNSPGRMDRDSSDLELVDNDGKGLQHVGMRFQNVEIPIGATIKNAYIEFECDEAESGAADLRFYCDDTDDATSFTSNAFDISSRPKTSNYVQWSNVPPWNQVDEKHQTEDLSPIIQEVVDRDGWAFGNSLVAIVVGSGLRTAESYDGEPSNAPLLVVDFVLEQYIVSRYDDDQGFKVWLGSDGHLSFGIDDDALWGPDDVVTSTDTYHDSAWHNFAASKDSQDGIYLYVDGELMAVDPTLAAKGTLSSDSAVLNIGCDGPTKSDYYRGNIDELCITNTTITSGQAERNARLYRSEGRLRSVEIAPSDNFVWDSVSFKRNVPAGTYLNISVLDTVTGQELMKDGTDHSYGSFDLSSLNPVEHPSLYLEARLRGSETETPALMEWGAYIREPDSPISIMDIETIYISEDTLYNNIVYLSDYFEDSYSTYSGSVYEVHSNTENGNLNLSVTGSNLAVDYLADNWTGNASVIISCTNIFGLSIHSPAFDIVVMNVNDPPSSWHMTPVDGEILEYINVTLSWDSFDVDSDTEDISFDLYFGKTENPSLYISDLITRNHTVADLEDASTYYWYLEAKDNDSSSVSMDGIWSFTIDQYIPTPRTKLLFPQNTGVIDTNSINLEWEVTNPTEDSVSYRLLLNKTVDNLMEIAVTNEENYLITNLDVGSIYYWTVIPVAGPYEGECISGIWSFFVNDSFQPLIEFDISTEISRLDIERDVNATFNITVKNAGNAPITLMFDTDGPLADYSYVQGSTVAQIGVATRITVTVNLPGIVVDGIMENGNLQLILRATYKKISKELTIPVTLTGEGPATVDDDSDGGDTENESGSSGGICWSIWTWFIIILIALVVVQVIYIFKRRRDKEESQPILPVEEPRPYRRVPEGYEPMFVNPRYSPENLQQKNMDEGYGKYGG